MSFNQKDSVLDEKFQTNPEVGAHQAKGSRSKIVRIYQSLLMNARAVPEFCPPGKIGGSG